MIVAFTLVTVCFVACFGFVIAGFVFATCFIFDACFGLIVAFTLVTVCFVACFGFETTVTVSTRTFLGVTGTGFTTIFPASITATLPLGITVPGRSLSIDIIVAAVESALKA